MHTSSDFLGRVSLVVTFRGVVNYFQNLLLSNLILSVECPHNWFNACLGDLAFIFSEAASNNLLPQAYNKSERHRITDTASYLYRKVELVWLNFCPRFFQCRRTILWTRGHRKNKMRIYFIAAGQSFGHAATNWHSKSYYSCIQKSERFKVVFHLSLSRPLSEIEGGITLAFRYCIFVNSHAMHQKLYATFATIGDCME